MLDLNKVVEPILDKIEVEKEESINLSCAKRRSNVTGIVKTKLEGRPNSQTVCLALPQTTHLVMTRRSFSVGHVGMHGAKRIMLTTWLIWLAVGVYK
jgi:hypothetical protein